MSEDDYATYDDYDVDIDDVDSGRDGDIDEHKPNRRQRRAAERERGRGGHKRRENAKYGRRRVDAIGIEWDDETWWVPADPTDWSTRAILAFEEGKALTAMRELLLPNEDGSGGWEEFMARNYSVKQAREIFGLVAKVGGFRTAGN